MATTFHTSAWQEGPPPHAGWWLSLATSDNRMRWRWWDGQRWSLGALAIHTAQYAGQQANAKALPAASFRWCGFWPTRARVARVNPDTCEVTGHGPQLHAEAPK